MGFRFRRSIRLLPGLRINLGKRGASVSLGVRGAHVTVGPTGTRTTVGAPGTGLSYTHLEPPAHGEGAPAVAPGRGSVRWLLAAVLLVVALAVAGFLAIH